MTLDTLFRDLRKWANVIYTDADFLPVGKKMGYLFAQVPNHRGRRHWLTFRAGRTPEWRGQYSEHWLRRTLSSICPDLVYSFVYSFTCLHFADWIARKLGVPHLPHITDHSSEFFASSETKEILTRTPKRIVIGNNMREHYEKRLLGLDFEILHNGPEKEDFLSLPALVKFHQGRPLRVCFIGGLFHHLHADGVEDIIMAIQNLRRKGIPIVLDCYGARHPEDFLNELFALPGIQHHGIVMPLEERRGLVHKSEVCLVPASFDVKQSNNYMYSFPTKLTELLASSRPTLVYGPPGMEAVRFCQNEGVGTVINKRSIQVLENNLSDMVDNYPSHVAKAERDAEKIRLRHSAQAMRKRFHAIIEDCLFRKRAA